MPARPRPLVSASGPPAADAPRRLPPQIVGDDSPSWRFWALVAIALATLLRMAVNAAEWTPINFDEAQYWAYGEAMQLGFYSKPPMVAWLIEVSTRIFGDQLFAVRLLSPLIHAWIAWLVFAIGRRLFEPRTGFWAALTYLAMPGVTVSSSLMTTDPPMMAGWALALYAFVRLQEAVSASTPAPASGGAANRAAARSGAAEPWRWWALLGAAVGLGLLSKYTMIAFVGGAVGYALFSRPGAWGARPSWGRGALGATAAALIVFSPNLIWNAQNGFPTITHLGDNASISGDKSFQLGEVAQFLLLQFAVFGPLAFAMGLACLAFGRWRAEWQFRLLAWFAAPLLIAITAQAFASRAHGNWAAPIYIALSIMTAAWILDRGRARWLALSAFVGGVAALGFWSILALYAESPSALPARLDPMARDRGYAEICDRAFARGAGPGGGDQAGGALLVSAERKLMSHCLWRGGLSFAEIRQPLGRGGVRTHYQLVSPLEPRSPSEMILVASRNPLRIAALLARFETVEILEAGAVQTHADRRRPYTIARVSGYRPPF